MESIGQGALIYKRGCAIFYVDLFEYIVAVFDTY